MTYRFRVSVLALLLFALNRPELLAQHAWRVTSPRPAAETLEALTVSDETFLLAGHGGLIMTSTDGLNWTRQTSGTREQLLIAAHHAGVWFAQGYSGAIFTSTDARLWQQRTNGGFPGTIAYGNGRFVNLVNGVSPSVRSSADAENWTETPFIIESGHAYIHHLCYALGRFWLLQGYSTARPVLWSSPDGILWTVERESTADQPMPESIHSLYGSADRLIAVNGGGYGSNGYQLAYKRDATGAWSPLNTPAHMNAFAYSNGRYLCRSALTTYESSDGDNWTELPGFPPSIQLETVVTRGDVWIALDRNKLLMRANDGQNWGFVSHHFHREGEGLAFVNGQFLTANGIRSTDGIHWSEDGFNVDDVKLGGFRFFKQISPVNGRAIITVSRDYAYEYWLTTDGVSGKQVAQFGHTVGSAQVHYASGLYAALNSVDGARQLHTSPDAETWTSRPITELAQPIYEITEADGEYFYGYADGYARFKSKDTVNWTPAEPATPTPQTVRWHQTLAGPTIQAAVGDGTWSSFHFSNVASSRTGQAVATGNGVTVAMAGNLFAVAAQTDNLRLTGGIPELVEAIVGEELSLSVEASSRDGSPLRYQWFADGVDMFGEDKETFSHTFSAEEQRPSTLGVRITDGESAASLESELRVFNNPGPSFFLQTDTNMQFEYKFLSFNRYEVRLWAPVSSPGTTTHVWKRNSEVIPGQNTDTLTYEISPEQVGDRISVTVSNERGSISSGDYIEKGPVPKIYDESFSTYFSEQTGRGVLQLRLSFDYTQSVQWRRNGVPIPGATGSFHYDDDLTPDESGFYDAVLTSPFGTTTSTSRFVAATGARLSNLSVRAWSGAGVDAITPGVVLARNGGFMRPLIRAVGPGLAGFEITDTMDDPALTVVDQSGTSRVSNAKWGNYGYDLSPLFQLLGAFPLGFDSLDAALLAHSMPIENNVSRFTVPVTAPEGDEGEVLVEVYDFGGSPTDRLINLSCRARVTPGHPFITGFVVSGEGAVKLLIRAVGPTLADFEITHPLGNPRLVLRNQAGQEIGNNDQWFEAANRTDMEAARSLVGGFPLRENSYDSAMFVTLEAGVYTAQVEDLFGEGGIGLVEIYEVP